MAKVLSYLQKVLWLREFCFIPLLNTFLSLINPKRVNYKCIIAVLFLLNSVMVLGQKKVSYLESNTYNEKTDSTTHTPIPFGKISLKGK
jgi:hypothetical protein